MAECIWYYSCWVESVCFLLYLWGSQFVLSYLPPEEARLVALNSIRLISW